VFFQKKTALRNTPRGRGGGPPICYGLLHGGGGIQKWPKSCYVICEWPLAKKANLVQKFDFAEAFKNIGNVGMSSV